MCDCKPHINGIPLMDDAPKAQIDANERATIFHEQYGNDLDAGVTLANIVIALGDYLRRIVGDAAADAGMALVVAPVLEIAGVPLGEPSAWREALEKASCNCFSEWPLGERLHDLVAYAVYGIVMDGSVDAEQRANNLEQAIKEAEEFLQATPAAQWGISPNSDLHNLVRLASNRWALDVGRPVEPAALAKFACVTEGRIRNLMSGPKRAFSSVDGRIPAHEAVAWLSGRPEFWNSIWRDQSLPQYAVKHRPPLEQAIFIPVARDGSPFHPGLARGGGYTIGEKGDEKQIADFDAALLELQRMPVPYWRRPNANSNWGIVAGVRWARLDKSDLEIISKDPDHRLPEDGRA
ncbi:hypothetical protein AMST5_01332 [freshwater sediment metagenome]|uniref:Uncharacterized protein n=1 Tax=freshwater sediment metagenome TaxID=556182 RepID=A0AA48RCJ0_9ZZZZ